METIVIHLRIPNTSNIIEAKGNSYRFNYIINHNFLLCCKHGLGCILKILIVTITM